MRHRSCVTRILENGEIRRQRSGDEKIRMKPRVFTHTAAGKKIVCLARDFIVKSTVL
jgi:hypothetical protein